MALIAFTVSKDDVALIAAAPDMLAALRIVTAQLTTIDNEEACNAVRIAISKAEGKACHGP
jgi:hypothetical protein